MEDNKKADQSANAKKNQFDYTGLKAQRALLQPGAIKAPVALRKRTNAHPGGKVSEPPTAPHPILALRISCANELGRLHQENARDDLASVQHSPQKD